MTTEKIDTIQKALDYAIRDAEKKNKQSGYKIGERIYHNYMHNDVWDKYLQGIPDDINELYKDKISTIYKRAKTEIGYFEIWLFDAIVEFQKKHNLKISETLDYSFEFYVVDQDSCKEFIK